MEAFLGISLQIMRWLQRQPITILELFQTKNREVTYGHE
jgi:hypothetical protein